MDSRIRISASKWKVGSGSASKWKAKSGSAVGFGSRHQNEKSDPDQHQNEKSDPEFAADLLRWWWAERCWAGSSSRSSYIQPAAFQHSSSPSFQNTQTSCTFTAALLQKPSAELCSLSRQMKAHWLVILLLICLHKSKFAPCPAVPVKTKQRLII